jgi:Fe-S cluster assembly protein SufD
MSLTEALKSRDASLLPSRRDEAWRYTDLRAAVRTIPEPSPLGTVPATPGPFAAIKADLSLVIINGRGPEVLSLDAGQVLCVELRLVADSHTTSHQSDLRIDLASGAQLTLLESHEGLGSAYLSSANLTIHLAEGASLERVVILDEPSDAVSVITADITLSHGASLKQTVLTKGAMRQRFETQVTHPGGGASLRLDGVYMLADKCHADLTTVVNHVGPGGTTDQLTKGAVRDASRAVFQGQIQVTPGADQTDARMGHHALILSDRAEIDAKPELEIFADDVSCAHGNTVGALDEDALFYICSRGVPLEEARAMLVQAFGREVIDRIETEAVRQVAQAWLAGAGAGGSDGF